MHKPRVLVIENALSITGGVTSIERSCGALKDSFHFSFAVPKNSKISLFFRDRNFEVTELPMIELRKSARSLILYLPFLVYNSIRLFRLVKAAKIDIVVVNDFYNLIPACYSFFGGRVPYVCYVRFLPSKFPKLLVKVWLSLNKRYAQSIVAVSRAVRRELPSSDKVVVIGDPLPTVEKYPELSGCNASKSAFTFLYLSNFIPGKGQEYALEAFAKVHNELPDWKLRFVGGDMGLEKNRLFKKDLQNRAQSLGMEKKIEWEQFTNEVELEYRKADVVLNFSESESFSMTCLDALFYGRPVIASDCGGPAEIVDHGRNGLIVPNKSIDSMASAMINLASDRTLRLEMCGNAKELVIKKFGPDQTVFKLKNVYTKNIVKMR